MKAHDCHTWGGRHGYACQRMLLCHAICYYVTPYLVTEEEADEDDGEDSNDDGGDNDDAGGEEQGADDTQGE